MSRLQAIDPTTATGDAKELLDRVRVSLGRTPNMMRTMANSPAVLDAYLAVTTALGRGRLSAKLREQIALAVSEANACEYCVSAHTAIGKLVGVPEPDLRASRHAGSGDPKVEAALQFALAVAARRGQVTDGEVARVREAGYVDGEIAEIIAHVAVNVFTNYFNLVAQTAVDFPRVEVEAAVVR